MTLCAGRFQKRSLSALYVAQTRQSLPCLHEHAIAGCKNTEHVVRSVRVANSSGRGIPSYSIVETLSQDDHGCINAVPEFWLAGCRMNTKEIIIALAETEMAFRLHIADTEMPFLYFECNQDVNHERVCVEAQLERIIEFQRENRCRSAFAEYCCLMNAAGNALLHYDRMLFHGVGMIYKGRGYILTAPSGTGKTTQFRNLHTIYGEDCRIISGDKPVIWRTSKEEFRIYPSPWNGKENWAGEENAGLFAVIWLEQGSGNLIRREKAEDMVLPCLSQILYDAPDRRTVHEACQMAEGFLSHVPIYKFINTGDLASSKMLGDFLDKESEK